MTTEAALSDLGIELLSIRGAVCLALGDEQEAVRLTRKAVESLTSGVEQPYLVHHRYADAALAAGRPLEARVAAQEALRLLHSALDGLSDQDRARGIRSCS